MQTSDAPVLRHREWRFLLRDFVKAHPVMRAPSSDLIRHTLAPAASLAWWLAKTSPELLVQKSLHLLVPGAGHTECWDSGRWFSYLPWLLGRPELETRVTLVGDELMEALNPSKEMTVSQLRKSHASVASALVADRPESTIFNGTLGQWRASTGRDEPIDACVLFSPGFISHYRAWLTEDDLLPLMRQGVPMGVFCYSKMDGLEDGEVLRLLGIELEPDELALNPWRLQHEMQDFIGCFAQYARTLRATSIPATLNLDTPTVRDFLQLETYARDDFETFGADQALERLGASWPVQNQKTGADDAIVVLPYEHGILASTGALGDFDEKGFVPFEPPLLVPADLLAGRPGDDQLLERIFWALRLHRDWVAPKLEEREEEEDDELFGGLSEGDFNEGVRQFVKEALGEDVDPEEFMRQMRIQGGPHGPTHPCWWDLFETLGWKLEDYEDEPERFEPAFWVAAGRHGETLPVICEAYAYFPDDADDELAQEALQQVAEDFPDGAFLLFKSIPFQEVGGHKYHFGGMLYWQDKWRPFALTPHMQSADDILDQIESSFTFETVNPKYADDNCSLTVPFNRMCQGMDPNEPTEVVGLRQGAWVTLMPA